MDALDKLVGLVNIVHIGTAAALGYFVDYRIFVCGISWVSRSLAAAVMPTTPSQRL